MLLLLLLLLLPKGLVDRVAESLYGPEEVCNLIDDAGVAARACALVLTSGKTVIVQRVSPELGNPSYSAGRVPPCAVPFLSCLSIYPTSTLP